MTVAGSVAGRRYSLQHADGREGAAERWIGYDERLARPVVAWVLERDEAHPDREYLLSVARSLARAPQPVFLRILDIVPEPQQLSIILEMPEPPDDGTVAPRLPALAAARMVLELAEALDAAEVAGVALARLSNEYLHRGDDGGVRADPIGLFLPGAQPVAPSAAPLVDLLGAVIEPRAPVSAPPFEQAADAEVRRMLVRWERHDGDLTQLIDELRDIVGALAGAPAPVPAPMRSVPETSEVTAEFTPLAPAEAPGGRPRPRREPRRRAVRWGVAIPAAAAVLAVVLGLAGLLIASQIGMSPAGLTPGGDGDSGPPVSQPAANEVTVGLQAQEPSNVRVTVDGVVEFDGVLQSGERQLWEGSERIYVWTDSGQTLLLSVNGHDLGPYSPAMGQREGDAEISGWNRIEFSFAPGWAP